MKKTILILLVALSMSACQKEYSCECYTNPNDSYIRTIRGPKAKAEKECKETKGMFYPCELF